MTDALHPFSYREFRFYWAARLCSTIAQSALVVVIGWQVYIVARLTLGPRESALQLGIVGLVQFLPLFVLTLVTGWTADRVDRRLLARLCIVLQILCAGSLAWFSYSGQVSLGALFSVAALLGVARAFHQPAVAALGPNLVPPEVLPRAIATNSIAGRAGQIAGPPLGGYLFAVGAQTPYAASAALLGVSLLCMLMIRPIERTTMDRARAPWRQMVEGLQYVMRNRLVLGAISLDLFAVLLGGATAMLPVYARDILNVGSEGLGHLRGAVALGALATALWFSLRPLRRGAGMKMLAAVGTFGVATIVFGLSRWMPLSLAALVVCGGADMLSVYVRQSLIQLSTPNEMRGRVGAVSTLFVSASNELGEAESGFLAALVGPTAAVVGGGVGAIGVTLLWAKLFPALRLARDLRPPTR